MRSSKIAVIDYDIGNVHSVCHALTYLGYKSFISRDQNVLRTADAFILPGVGAFGKAMENLQKFDLLNVLSDQVRGQGKPILGICLGMQILGHTSQESPGVRGLGWIDFEVKVIPSSVKIKVPHVGWNTIKVGRKNPLFVNFQTEPDFYFDHSYYTACADDCVQAYCDYGLRMPAVISQKNITGVQFHPEKSQTNGLRLFRNYLDGLGLYHA
jgi:imidazole glycerol-phosphate synthase subunit HisH